MTTRVEKYEKADGSSGYDALNRLTAVDYGDGQTQSYTFDAMGNRLSRQDSVAGTTNYAYDAANMLLSTTGAGASAYTNDADGNTLSGGGRTLGWDSQNRLASCTTSSASTQYTYGADGLRRRAVSFRQLQPIKHGPATQGLTDDPGLDTVTDEGTSYAYDGTMLVREGHAQTTNGVSSLQPNVSGQPASVTTTYFIGARGPEYRRDDTAQETDSQGRTVTKARWYVYDGLGSVVGEVDPSGNLTSSPKYDVYGAVRANGGSATSKQGFVGSLGHLSEAETGLIYMRARYYDPAMGRFASEDHSKSGLNWYAYCKDEPINHADPTGKDGELMGTIMSSDISATLDGIGSDFGVVLEGEVKSGAWEGSGGVMNDWAMGLVRQLEEEAGSGSGTWEYYTKPIADGSGNSLKAWMRYNDELEVYDLYLNDWGGADGAFSHPVPYAGPM